jgi:hypothetical protein
MQSLYSKLPAKSREISIKWGQGLWYAIAQFLFQAFYKAMGSLHFL